MRINKKKYCSICILFCIGVIGCTPSKKFLLKTGRSVGSDTSYIRVLIKKTSDFVSVSSSGRIKISKIKNHKIIYNAKGKTLKFFPDHIKEPLLVEAWGSLLKVNGRHYRGMLELHNIVGKLQVINVVQFEDYLASVVPSEIIASWPYESLKAQAVAARTYAYYHLQKKSTTVYDLDATTNFQVYKGRDVEHEATTKAVKATAGEIMIYNNKPILAFFHSTCGGRIIDNKYVWNGEDLPYLVDKKCPYCKDSPYYSWKERISLYTLKVHLKKKYHTVGKIRGIALHKHQGRVMEVIIRHSQGRLKLTGNEFRLLFPAKKIKSLFFRAIKTKNGLFLYGHGWGHGVGMCQFGAKGMARAGASYKEILHYYYKDVKLLKLRK
jgi:stage II sporulation protein D